MKTLEKVKLVEYHEGLAKGVAKMWNESRDGWGGDSTVTTEQEVKEKEANSTNLHLFLAMVGEEVIGYCGLSEYKEDQGALYIPLLNVHPDYYGMKIGKQLVLKALEKTVELNWPRLDLFTWAGNTKAVPLYKKCGFFWEERDDTTHLMNFTPSVLKLDYLKPFFEEHDWYTTSKRVIEVKPDGIKENGYTFYEYKWEEGDEFVRVQFERTGRGLRLIETQDLLIEISLPTFKLLEKEQHDVTYRVVNKTATPFDISLVGMSSEFVDHTFEESVEVSDEWIGTFPVTLSMPKSEPSPWKTHPIVEANLVINGSVVPLKMGVFPKQAGKLEIRSVKQHWRRYQKGTLFLDLESQFEEDTIWSIKLPVNDVVKWNQSVVTTTIKGNERVSIPLQSELLKNGFLAAEVEVLVERQNGQKFMFTTELSLAFPGFGAKFGGENDTHWYGYNGPFYVKIEKRNHIVSIASIRSSQNSIRLLTPQLGKPFSEEFSKKEASSVEYIDLPESFVLKTTQKSEAFAPLMLNTYFSLYGDGLIEIRQEVVNNGENDLNDITLLQPLHLELNEVAIPQKDGVMIGGEPVIPFMDYIRDKDISESWMFMSSEGETKGLAWPKEAVGRKEGWRFGIEYSVGTINAQGASNLGPIQIGVNIVSTWEQWRELVVEEEATPLKEIPIYALEAKDGNTISTIGDQVDYSFRSMLTPYIHGSLTLFHEGVTFEKKVYKEDGVSNINLQLKHHTPGIKRIEGSFRSPGQSATVHYLQFVKGKKEIEIVQNEDNWIVENGLMSFKAAPSYYPGIYSLTYDGKETLHHQYPVPGPKAWWNPWGGGLRYTFNKVSAYSILKEKTTTEPVTKVDQYGNTWTGLCLSTIFTEHETMKGITLRQYALTLPEVPVLATYAEIQQHSGRTFEKEVIDFEAFLKPGEKITSCYAKVPSAGIFDTYYAGHEEFVLKGTQSVTIGSDERKERLTILHPSQKRMAEVYMNQEIFLVASSQKWSASSGEVVTIKPTMMLLDDDDLATAYSGLQGIIFK